MPGAFPPGLLRILPIDSIVLIKPVLADVLFHGRRQEVADRLTAGDAPPDFGGRAGKAPAEDDVPPGMSRWRDSVAGKDDEGDKGGEVVGALPVSESGPLVRSHQPEEIGVRSEEAVKVLRCLPGVAGSRAVQFPVAGFCAGNVCAGEGEHIHSPGGCGGGRPVLEGRNPAGQEEDAVEAAVLDGRAGDPDVSGMGRVK